LDDLSRRGNAAQAHRLALEASQLKGLERRLSALNPLAVLSRGYAVVTHKQNDKIVSSASSVKTGEDLNVRVADGNFDVRVTQ
ncbi:MAG: exodeoxyribonuclease VII large subunit, partial [Anaerolineales bacterium]|nr:exodeoxyribonuclease VII large subunit [Anaerolineales bacterium]